MLRRARRHSRRRAGGRRAGATPAPRPRAGAANGSDRTARARSRATWEAWGTSDVGPPEQLDPRSATGRRVRRPRIGPDPAPRDVVEEKPFAQPPLSHDDGFGAHVLQDPAEQDPPRTRQCRAGAGSRPRTLNFSRNVVERRIALTFFKPDRVSVRCPAVSGSRPADRRLVDQGQRLDRSRGPDARPKARPLYGGRPRGGRRCGPPSGIALRSSRSGGSCRENCASGRTTPSGIDSVSDDPAPAARQRAPSSRRRRRSRGAGSISEGNSLRAARWISRASSSPEMTSRGLPSGGEPRPGTRGRPTPPGERRSRRPESLSSGDPSLPDELFHRRNARIDGLFREPAGEERLGAEPDHFLLHEPALPERRPRPPRRREA